MLATAIKKSGYAVDEANDGPVAIEKIRKRPYHLVITDLRLPNLSGLEVLARTARSRRDNSRSDHDGLWHDRRSRRSNQGWRI